MDSIFRSYTKQDIEPIRNINIIQSKYSACVSVNNNTDKYYAKGIKPRRRLKVTSYEVD